MSNINPTASNVEVYVRVLPEINCSMENFRVLDDEKTIYVRSWQDFAKSNEGRIPNYLVFKTNGIFYNASQEKIFNTVADNGFFDRLLYGYNGIIMSYGQTGSGKTVTTTGLESTFKDRGILPRVLETLFDSKQKLDDRYKISIKMRYVETNRNYMMDLLSDDDTIYDMNTYNNIKAIKVKSLYDGLKLIFKAEARKTMRQTNANTREQYKSNMGNTIVTFLIYSKGRTKAVSEGTLHVVDLAGIDTIGNNSCLHKTGYEVGNGNLAKSQIEQLVLVINENFSKTAELKQRICIIIHYLRNTLNSNSLIRIITHVRIQREDLKICTSMLRLGCAFKGMVPKKLNRFYEDTVNEQYKVVTEQLEALRKEMDLNAMLCNEDMTYDLSNERLDYIKRLAKEYLESNDKSELVLLSTTDTVVMMQVIKAFYKSALEPRKSYPKFSKMDGSDFKIRSVSNKGHDGMTVISKNSKRMHSIASVVSQESKRSNHAKKTLKKIITSKATFDVKSKSQILKAQSVHSIKSKTTSKIGKKKRVSTGSSTAVIRVPEEIPTFSVAWSKFKVDNNGKYTETHTTLKSLDTDLDTMTKDYNKEVVVLEELKNIANQRKNDLSHAIMIRDIDTTLHISQDLHDFQEDCTQLLNKATRQLIEQKEKLLTLQADMQVNIDYRSKLQKELNKAFDEYCLKRYGVLIPDVTDEDITGQNDENAGNSVIAIDNLNNDEDNINAKPSEMMSINNETVDNIDCLKHQRFEELKAYMKRELARVSKRKARKQKWIMTFKCMKCM